ncbi:cuticular protein 16 [Bombus vancouverensis nearcticus]|uniref:cuticular protein 16 n=1 Tax=Bombus vancouverensis nearcticus TaxID=2705178 RepID=UPI00143BA882|nr:uncharacterized protein LOC117164451 isoform X1 [Bombus vancouverensis nearcticus]XP_050483751.1 uncharacterized protein LOC126870257 [Bombus huntii]
MILMILLSAIFGRICTTPIANVWLGPIGSVTPLRQYHVQDGSGGYRYSFTGPHHAKSESSSNGITRGGYSYIDSNGILQTVTYTADDENGFRVSASNLPQPPKNDVRAIQDKPQAKKKSRSEELQESRLTDRSNYQSNILSYEILPPYFSFANHDTRNLAVREIAQNPNNPFLLSKSEAERIEVPKPDPSLSKILPSSTISSSPSSSIRSDRQRKNEEQSSVDTIQTPVTVPAPYVLPVLPYRLLHSALHHTQDSLGQYDYSYTGDSSAKTESRSLDGTTRGAYSYIDPNGLLQQVHYVADHNGFRVMATNLPQAK